MKKVKADRAAFCFVCTFPQWWTKSIFLRTEMAHIWVCNDCWQTFDFQPYIPYNKWLTFNSEEKLRAVLKLKPYRMLPWVKAAAYRHVRYNLGDPIKKNRGKRVTSREVAIKKRYQSSVNVENYTEIPVHRKSNDLTDTEGERGLRSSDRILASFRYEDLSRINGDGST